MMKKKSALPSSNTFEYVMLVISILLIASKSSFVLLGMLIFTLTALNLIEKALVKKNPDFVKKILDITFRLSTSIGLILFIINQLFVELDTSLVLYIILLVPLTFLLVLTRK